MRYEQEVLRLDQSAESVSSALTDAVNNWAAAMTARELKREQLANAERTLEFHELELRQDQETLRDLDKNSPTKASVMTAGDKEGREKQMQLYLQRLQRTQGDDIMPYTRVWREVKRLEREATESERMVAVEDKRISALRALAELTAARLITFGKLVG